MNVKQTKLINFNFQTCFKVKIFKNISFIFTDTEHMLQKFNTFKNFTKLRKYIIFIRQYHFSYHIFKFLINTLFSYPTKHTHTDIQTDIQTYTD